MMEGPYSMLLLQRKLGALLSYLGGKAAIPHDALERIIQDSPYFDFFENGTTKRFLDESLEEAYQAIFGQKAVGYRFEYLPGMLDWVGEAYMAISLTLHKPLRRVFHIMPLREMVSLYPDYHELGFQDIIDRYKEVEEERNILDILLKKRGMDSFSFSELCLLHHSTIRNLVRYPKALELASFESIELIAGALGVSVNLFKTRSAFLYFGQVTFEKDPKRRELFMHLLKVASAIKDDERRSADEKDQLLYLDHHLSEEELLRKAEGYLYSFFYFFDGSCFVYRQGRKGVWIPASQGSVILWSVYGRPDYLFN